MVQPVVQPVLGRDANVKNPATKALALLAVLAVLPAFIPIPVNVNIVLTASLCVSVGCWRSVKATPPEDSLSRSVILSVSYRPECLEGVLRPLV